MTNLTHPSIPGVLHWRNDPSDWSLDGQWRLSISAPGMTDLFYDPAGAAPVDNAPCALFAPPDAQFLLSARVSVEFASTYDAGVLQLRGGEAAWAKLCFERSPQRQPMIVSVVTRGLSDDCNSTIIEGTVASSRSGSIAQAGTQDRAASCSNQSPGIKNCGACQETHQ